MYDLTTIPHTGYLIRILLPQNDGNTPFSLLLPVFRGREPARDTLCLLLAAGAASSPAVTGELRNTPVHVCNVPGCGATIVQGYRFRHTTFCLRSHVTLLHLIAYRHGLCCDLVHAITTFLHCSTWNNYTAATLENRPPNKKIRLV